MTSNIKIISCNKTLVMKTVKLEAAQIWLNSFDSHQVVFHMNRYKDEMFGNTFFGIDTSADVMYWVT